MQDVVLVMPEGDLVAAEFLREVEHLFASHPRTEETGLLLLAKAGGCLWMLLWHSSLLNRWLNLKASGPYVEGNAQCIAERLQITSVRLVVDVLHPHVQGLYTESWVINLGALR